MAALALAVPLVHELEVFIVPEIDIETFWTVLGFNLKV